MYKGEINRYTFKNHMLCKCWEGIYSHSLHTYNMPTYLHINFDALLHENAYNQQRRREIELPCRRYPTRMGVFLTLSRDWYLQNTIVIRSWRCMFWAENTGVQQERTLTLSRYRANRIAYSELKWCGGWSTGTVGWLSPSEQGQYLERWPAMNTKCLVPLPFLPDLILWSTENLSPGSPVLVPPETQ